MAQGGTGACMQVLTTAPLPLSHRYMAQGGAGAWASNDAFGRHSTCSHLWGNVPGFNHTNCAEACAQHGANGTGAPRCLQLCDAARCPHGNGTYENGSPDYLPNYLP